MNKPAYPSTDPTWANGGNEPGHYPGMTYRELVAKDVMAALTRSTETTLNEIERRAEIAVYAADQLIAALDKSIAKHKGGAR